MPMAEQAETRYSIQSGVNWWLVSIGLACLVLSAALWAFLKIRVNGDNE